MDQENMSNSQTTPNTPWAIIVVIVIAIVGVSAWVLTNDEEPVPVVETVPETIELEPVVEEPIIEEPAVVEEPIVEVVEDPIVVPEEPKVVLPSLEESDGWLKERLPSITWRKELLKLVIDDDMIRRFVVFTDNFSQGMVAYEHSPLVKPASEFTAKEINQDGQITIKWDEMSTRRFSLYVDLLRSLDSDELITWYYELKPLIDEAYRELGYPDEDFTDILQDAMTKVLDMEVPKERQELVRPSVMYQYKDEYYESMDDADKLLLRLGKENLLVVKSILLEFSEKLARERDE